MKVKYTCQDRKRARWEGTSSWSGFLFFLGGGAWGDDKNVLKLDYADSCLTANILTLMGLHTYDM